MDVSRKIIEILNKDERARRLKAFSERHIKEEGLKGEEAKQIREIVVMLAIKNNKEAFELMAAEVYDELIKDLRK